MIKGVILKDLDIHIDQRGFFSELIREDWDSFLGGKEIKQVNYSFGYPRIVRAWHRHLRGQVDFFVVLKGAMKFCAYDSDKKSETYGELDEFVLSSHKLQILRIPGNLWHGNMVVSNEPAFFVYMTSNLYNYKDPDEQRLMWNSVLIVPKSINGNKDDPRVGSLWDWYSSPNK